jgi:small-conductance mechanosensitive channel
LEVKEETATVSTEYIWETFDSLFKTVHRQGRRVEELEARLADLEQRLNAETTQEKQASQPFSTVNEMPAERAA